MSWQEHLFCGQFNAVIPPNLKKILGVKLCLKNDFF